MEVGSPSDEVVARWRRMLGPDETAQADRRRIPAARASYIAAHALTRALLSHAGSVAPSAWRFAMGELGKPEIDPSHRSNLRFSLSHTFGLAAAAVCLDHDVGIDVEDGDRRSPELRLAERFFSPAEVAIVRDSAGEARREAFFRVWTLKESYIKATGEGFRRSLRSFSFTLDPVTVALTPERADDPADWQFFEDRPSPHHFLAVSLHRPAHEPTKFVCRAVSPDEL